MREMMDSHLANQGRREVIGALPGWGPFLRTGRRHQRVRVWVWPVRLARGAGDRGDTAAGLRTLVPTEKPINGSERIDSGCDSVRRFTKGEWKCCKKTRKGRGLRSGRGPRSSAPPGECLRRRREPLIVQ
jgi:hypothetical protein